MAFRLEISIKARKDVEKAVNWYNEQLPGLGEDFLNDFRSTLGYIKDQPFSFRSFDEDTKEAILSIFPYLVIYRVSRSLITVIGVFNTHQNPTKKP